MTIALDDFYRLKSKVEKLKLTSERAKGALQEITDRLLEEFNCSTVEEAEALFESLRDKELVLSKKYTAAKLAFEQEWADKLRDVT